MHKELVNLVKRYGVIRPKRVDKYYKLQLDDEEFIVIDGFLNLAVVYIGSGNFVLNEGFDGKIKYFIGWEDLLYVEESILEEYVKKIKVKYENKCNRSN